MQRTDNPIVVIASDLHCLGVGSLLRPGFKLSTGNELGLNTFQKWLWSQFETLTAEIVERFGDQFVLILNGDLLEGNHHRTTEILAVDEAEHALAAIHTLEPLVKHAAETYIVEGTECHTKAFEGFIGRELGAVKCPDTGRHSWAQLDIEVCGSLGTVRHHISTTARGYLEASALSIHLGNMIHSRAIHGRRVPKWMAAAHRHVAGAFDSPTRMALVTPAWQCLTRHGHKVVPDGRIEVGFAVLDFRTQRHGLPQRHWVTAIPDYEDSIE
jgi:hypothetical protein